MGIVIDKNIIFIDNIESFINLGEIIVVKYVNG